MFRGIDTGAKSCCSMIVCHNLHTVFLTLKSWHLFSPLFDWFLVSTFEQGWSEGDKRYNIGTIILRFNRRWSCQLCLWSSAQMKSVVTLFWELIVYCCSLSFLFDIQPLLESFCHFHKDLELRFTAARIHQMIKPESWLAYLTVNTPFSYCSCVRISLNRWLEPGNLWLALASKAHENEPRLAVPSCHGRR